MWEFETDSGGLVKVMLAPLDDERFELGFTLDDSFDMTNKGDAFRIMGTIIDIIKSNKSDFRVPILQFSAKKSDRGRVKLYHRLAKTLKSYLGFKYLSTRKDPIDPNELLFELSNEPL
jgi:hypothetical protein